MKAKNKKVLTGAVTLGIIATVAVGGTLAYLTDITEKRANNFTFSEPISAILTEPAWDGVTDYLYPGDKGYPEGVSNKIIPIYGWTEKTDTEDPKPIFGYKKDATTNTENPVTTYSTTEGSGVGVPPTLTDKEYGNTTNKDMIPGQVALKDPKITNKSADIDEWVAAQVSFVYAGGDKEGMLLSKNDMQTIVDSMYIDWNFKKTEVTPTWELIGSDEISSESSQYTFYYKEILNKCTEGQRYGEATAPIFDSVKVNSDADNNDIKALNSIADGKGFVIYIEGFAVQSDAAADYDAFKEWGMGNDTTPAGVTFKNSPTSKKGATLNLENGGIVAKEGSGITDTPAVINDEEGGAVS